MVISIRNCPLNLANSPPFSKVLPRCSSNSIASWGGRTDLWYDPDPVLEPIGVFAAYEPVTILSAIHFRVKFVEPGILEFPRCNLHVVLSISRRAVRAIPALQGLPAIVPW